jgi:hypothetical protein
MKRHNRSYYFKRIFYYLNRKDITGAILSIRFLINPYQYNYNSDIITVQDLINRLNLVNNKQLPIKALVNGNLMDLYLVGEDTRKFLLTFR